jgi:hypothetical protein
MDAQLLCARSLIGARALRCEAVNAPETSFTDLKRPGKRLQVRGSFCALRGNITPL